MHTKIDYVVIVAKIDDAVIVAKIDDAVIVAEVKNFSLYLNLSIDSMRADIQHIFAHSRANTPLNITECIQISRCKGGQNRWGNKKERSIHYHRPDERNGSSKLT